MLLNNWEIVVSYGTTLKKGYVEFYYSRDCNNRLFAHYKHQVVKGYYTEKNNITEHTIEQMLKDAEQLHKTLLEHNSKYYYKSFIIKDISSEYFIFNKGGERIYKSFDNVEDCVKFIDEKLEK